MPGRPSRITLALFCVVTIVSGCNEQQQTGTAVRGPETAWARVTRTKELRAGYIVFPPTITKDPASGKVGGHFAATISEIGRQAGWRVTFVESDWSTFTAGLQSGRFDISIAPTFVTIPRATAVAFTEPLFYAGNSAIVRAGDRRFTKISDFDQPGMKIAVTQGEAGHEYAKANFHRAELIVHSGADQSLAFLEVIAGRADAALGDAYVTSQFAAAHREVRDLFADQPYNLTPVAWTVRSSDTELLNFVNASLSALQSQGALSQYERAAGAHWLHVRRDWKLD